MTISTTTSRASYNGNGVTTLFSVPFRFFQNSDLVVQLVTNSTGSSTTLLLTTHYTVSGADSEAGGSLTMLTPPAVGQTLVIRRVIAATQEVDYVAGDPFPAETHERALDRLTMLVQQGDELNSRALTLPPGDTTSGQIPELFMRASKLLAFDAAGRPTVVNPSNDSATDVRMDLASTDDSKGAEMVANQRGGTLQDVADAVGKVSVGMTVAAITTAVNAARAAGGGDVVSLPSSGALSGSTPVEIVGDFGDGILFDGRRATITGTGTAANQDGMFVGNKVGSIASQYFNKYKIANLAFVGPGVVGSSAGVHQQAAADIQLDNLHIRNWPIGLLLDGGLTSDYSGITTRANGIGIEARYFDDGAGGLNPFSPNANSFYGLRCYENKIAVKYDTNPAGCANWFGCNFEGNNYVDGTTTDGVKVLELTQAGHHNFIGCHLESNEGQYGIYYDGFDSGKSLVILGSEVIDAVGTNVHIEKGRFTSIGSRITNASSTHDIFMNTGARATLIDTEGAVTGDLSYTVAVRDGRIGFGVQPLGANPLIDMQSAPIVAASNIAQNFRNDTVQLRFQNTAGTRVGYIQTSAASNHTFWNDNALGGWTFGSGNTTRFYVGRGGAANIEPGADNTTTCGSASIRWSDTYSRQFRPGTGAPIWTSGAGTPEGVVTATVGSLYTRTDGGAATTLYVKETGTGNTGWVAK